MSASISCAPDLRSSLRTSRMQICVRFDDNSLERSGSGKQMGRSGNELQRFRPTQARQRLLIELDDVGIVTTDDQQRGSAHRGETISREVGPSAAGDHRTDAAEQLCRRDESRRRARADAEQPERKLGKRRLAIEPATASASRSANRAISNSLARSASSAGVKRSNNSVAMPRSFSAWATTMLRGLKWLEPLP